MQEEKLYAFESLWFRFMPLFLSLPSTSMAQIAPECAGVAVPSDYDEEKQQAHLNNYFAAGFIMTPMSPIQPFPKDSGASVGLELGFIPPMSCQERLVLGGTKTEDTNKLPVNPRPRLLTRLPDIGPIQLYSGLTLLPPVEIPDVRKHLTSRRRTRRLLRRHVRFLYWYQSASQLH